ncbi:class I SAM-dependent methyltransferase [Candidatus Woesebacteria bacterium]|nr:class I SAM-dependent methyltransferase [Candidatus Woesebacteria bacterium]
MFRNIFMRRFKLINKYIRSGKVLDIGCSNGVFLEIFKERGWEVWGVEPSKSAEVAEKHGIKVIKSDLENAKLPPHYFDVVILNHTLEHSDNPIKFLKIIKNLLTDEGLLFIDVPNFGSLSSRLLGKRWPYLLPNEHNFQFTKDSLTKIVRKNGYRVIHTESRSGLFEFANPMSEIFLSLIPPKKRFIKNILLFPYDLLSTILSMGDSMSVIANNV